METEFQDIKVNNALVLNPPSLSSFTGELVAQSQQNTNSDAISSLKSEQSPSLSVAQAVVKMLCDMGVEYAFGVSGGAIARLWAALHDSSLQVCHFRHEAGAAFAATEAYFASGRPAIVFTTTGPGITNALTGLYAARWEGAKVILLSGSTSAAQRGRWACQETSTYVMPSSELFTAGKLFDYAHTIESSDELSQVARRLALGLAQPGGFVAHLSIPTAIQTTSIQAPLPKVNLSVAPVTVSEQTISECLKLLIEGTFAIWVGFGARNAAAEIRQLAEITGAAVMCSPRAKGIFPEDHPQFVGVTGFAGHGSVLRYMQEFRPLRILVLGTRLGEFTSFWNPQMIPQKGFVHVDIDPEVPGVAYPSVETFAIGSDIGLFVKALLKYIPESTPDSQGVALPRPEHHVINPGSTALVRPQVLMDEIQRIIVDGSDAVVMAEGGNSFAWAINRLQFRQANRFRISTGFSSMGHTVTGVLGAALAHNGKAVAIVGDGAMLMLNEVNTSARYKIPAVWIVLNDGRYNMCEQGMAYLGLNKPDTTIGQVDFVSIARGMGADGICVDSESHIQLALLKAMTASRPFVVDVVIDPTQIPPTSSRNQSLMLQGGKY